MNSIILISDSSDEDEVPAKKLSRNVEITAFKRAQIPLDPITRTIPSAITVTCHSPTIRSDSAKSIVVTQKSNLSKTNAASTLQSVGRQHMDEFFGTQKKQLSTLTSPSLYARKRKISTPPSRKANVSPNDIQISNNTQTLPIISSVHSITASDTPPRKLLATPPHTAASLSDPIAITPQLIKPHLSPPNTTTPQISFPQLNNFDNNVKFNDNKCEYNIKNTNEKIIRNNNKIIANNNLNTDSKKLEICASLSNKVSNPSSSPANAPNSNTISINTFKTSKPVIIQDKTIRRIKPITLLQNTDDAWLKRHCTDISNDNACAEELIIPDEVDQYKSTPLHQIRKENLTSTQTNKKKVSTIPQIDLTIKGIDLAHLQGSVICVDDIPNIKRIKTELVTPELNNLLTSEKLANVNISKTPQVVPKATIDMPMPVVTVDQKKGVAEASSNKLSSMTSIQIQNKLFPTPNKPTAISTSTKVDSASTRLGTVTIKVDPAINRIDAKLISIESQSVLLPSSDSTKVLPNTEPVVRLDPLVPDYEELLQACRIADPTSDMEKLINTKLIKYYYAVHPDFVKSRGFRKTIRTTIERIREKPEFVYYNLKPIVDELKVRRKSNLVVVNNEESSCTTGNKVVDRQIKKLNKALYKTTKLINTLEQSEVDLDDEDSTYLQVERYKKRACMIYEKICDLTGESKNANRLVKKPLQFDGTVYPIFNRTIQAYVNKTKGFPDYWDILRMLQHCNTKHGFGLTMFEMKPIAQEAFLKIGKLLQSRRKTDLYETVTHYTANLEDPASSDPTLSAKLVENQKHYKRISDILEKYALKQDKMLEVKKEERLKSRVNDNGETDLSNASDLESETEEDEDEEEDSKALEEHVDDLANSDISEAESDCDDHKKTEKENNLDNRAITEKINDSKTVSLSVIKQTVESETDIIKKYDKINANISRSKTVTLPLNGVNDNRRALETKQIPNDNELSQIVLVMPPVAKANNTAKTNTVSSHCDDMSETNASNKTTIAEKIATSITAQTSRPITEIVISDEEA